MVIVSTFLKPVANRFGLQVHLQKLVHLRIVHQLIVTSSCLNHKILKKVLMTQFQQRKDYVCGIQTTVLISSNNLSQTNLKTSKESSIQDHVSLINMMTPFQ